MSGLDVEGAGGGRGVAGKMGFCQGSGMHARRASATIFHFFLSCIGYARTCGLLTNRERAMMSSARRALYR